jgi:myo-inositol-1(or 4)-monophosphatase
MNYSHGVPFYSISIGYAFKGSWYWDIYDPMRHECYCAEKGKGSYLNGTKIQVYTETDLRYALLATGFNMKIPETGRDNFPLFKHFMQTTARCTKDGFGCFGNSLHCGGQLDGMWEMHLSDGMSPPDLLSRRNGRWWLVI